MSIAPLTQLVPPPAQPVDATGDWDRVEAALGVALPEDYKVLLGTYGRGQFIDFVSLLDPFGPADTLVTRALRLREREQSTVDRYPDTAPMGFHPQRGGLLEWAGDDNGGSWCWITDGDPERWRTALWETKNRRLTRFDLNATGLLTAWLTGTATARDLLPLPTAEPWFQPFRHRSHAYVKLSDSALPYGARLSILKDALAPIQERGSWQGEEDDEPDDQDDNRQDSFAALDRDWLVTYETTYGHQIRLAYPPHDDTAVRTFAATVAPAMGCRIIKATDLRGRPIWS